MNWFGPKWAKIYIDNTCIEQVRHFSYLGRDISYDQDIEKKVTNFTRMCGTIWRMLGNKRRKETQIKFYKTMAIPTLLYCSETWVIKKNRRYK